VSVVLHSGLVFDGTDVVAGATSVAVQDDRIVAVGTEAAVREVLPEPDEVVDLAGRLVTPGSPTRTCIL
jgi:predicted amidohydrolase YtcJ